MREYCQITFVVEVKDEDEARNVDFKFVNKVTDEIYCPKIVEVKKVSEF